MIHPICVVISTVGVGSFLNVSKYVPGFALCTPQNQLLRTICALYVVLSPDQPPEVVFNKLREARIIHFHTMFRERSLSDQEISLDHCDCHYADYGLFATLALRVAVLESQIYNLEDFVALFDFSGKNHSGNIPLSDFFNSLTYDDKDISPLKKLGFY